ncbi:hypothetical protein [Beggiatoa leptomitoformis]|uniref:Uncharacterized protein n=1 Tax=Beggiatoa leptomitoformis TaxID=288004 RepID=A0A2N9YB39_9GAMM|nr:hypothetical protein [Beggiatoa leptomitoformis]ALG66947.1 hypothetical protein AL038_03470 [Beggiatoa leptomitoformis]AUI67685.1 hypothetical protein BLE401_02555 [Beggiatoa leptomitoformis]
MNKSLLILIKTGLCIGLLLCTTPSVFAEPPLNVLASSWADSPANSRKLYQRAAPSHEALYFLLILKAEDPFISGLQNDNKLPLKARWTSEGESPLTYVTTFDANRERRVNPNQARSRTEQTPPPPDVLDIYRLSTNLTAEQNTRPGVWRLDILFADESPVTCDRNQPCRYMIRTVLPSVNAIWTDMITESKDPLTAYSDSAPSGSPLYLWMSIKGGSDFLRELNRPAKLPIRHKWFRAYPVVGFRFETAVDAIPSDAAQLAVLKDQLQDEIKRNGVFDLRISSGRESVPTGVWRVDVVFADDTPLMCEQTPCSYQILVK